MFYVYFFYNEISELLYVGKTTNLEARITQHFCEDNWKQKEIKKILYAICNTKTDMDIYEKYYINKLKPKYNINLNNNDTPSFELPELNFLDYSEYTVKENYKTEEYTIKRSYTLRPSTVFKLKELKVFVYPEPNITYNEIVDEAICYLYDNKKVNSNL